VVAVQQLPHLLGVEAGAEDLLQWDLQATCAMNSTAYNRAAMQACT
jgi:hypothetical protein